MHRIGMPRICDELRPCTAKASQRQSPEDRPQEEPSYVVPIKEMKPIARTQLDCVRPGPPTEHAENHAQECDDICLRLKHNSTSGRTRGLRNLLRGGSPVIGVFDDICYKLKLSSASKNLKARPRCCQ